MKSILIISILGFLLSLALTYFIKYLCYKFNKLDVPNERSSHKKPKALMGGGAILISFLFILLCFFFVFPIKSNLLIIIIPFILCSITISAIGLIDDLFNLSQKWRFSFHILVSLVSMTSIFIYSEKPFTFLNLILIFLGAIWIIGNINVYNFMDGIDGIAAGCGIIFAINFAIFGILLNSTLITLLSFALIPSLLGFLFLNLPPAKIFMGDVGATFLGYTFSFIALLLAINKTENILIGIIILLPFLCDSGITFLKRMINKENIFRAHKSHLYQKLVISGWSHKKTSSLYVFNSILLGITVSLFYQFKIAILLLLFPIFIYLAFYIILLKKYCK
jgi:UDP-N-acetylmuramyl pentapeptide phosphotransferase/UDP-N-acetylglucosamine-1-phosphate transferase